MNIQIACSMATKTMLAVIVVAVRQPTIRAGVRVIDKRDVDPPQLGDLPAQPRVHLRRPGNRLQWTTRRHTTSSRRRAGAFRVSTPAGTYPPGRAAGPVSER